MGKMGRLLVFHSEMGTHNSSHLIWTFVSKVLMAQADHDLTLMMNLNRKVGDDFGMLIDVGDDFEMLMEDLGLSEDPPAPI